jgi:type III pantothenate kinase
MKATVVADIGNSLIKWGRCADGAVQEKASLPPDDRAAWEQQLQSWNLAAPLAWAVAGVHRARRDALVEWLRQRGDTVCMLERADQLPLTVAVEHPDRVGIDRLLNAVAAKHGQPPQGRRRKNAAAVIIDAGSAITVDWVDASGVFRGGAILPGLRLMAKALHDYTDLLPLVEITEPPAALGTSSVAAMRSGIFYAALGGITMLSGTLRGQSALEPDHFFTGGDAELLNVNMGQRPNILWPTMTLEGIRLSTEALP